MAYDSLKSQSFPPAEPLACRRCGAITTPLVTPGTGPHAYKANCPDCGGFMRWLSKFTPEEQAARRESARLEAIAQKPASPPQLDYLKSLGDRGPAPANMAEASQRIARLKGKVAS